MGEIFSLNSSLRSTYSKKIYIYFDPFTLFTHNDYFWYNYLSPIDRNSVVAEILVRTLENSTVSTIDVITRRLQINRGIFDNSYKKYENKGTCIIQIGIEL